MRMSRLVLALLLSLFAGEVVAFQRACDNWQGLPFNEATMKGAHNAYELKYSVAELVRCPNTNAYDGCVANIELDLSQAPGGNAVWSLSHDHYEEDHPKGTLESYFAKIAEHVLANPAGPPLTLSFDVKSVTSELSAWPAQFEAALLKHLEHRHFFTPAHFYSKRNTQTLADAVKQGWPTLGELRGKVICVISGNEEELKFEYSSHASRRQDRLCFSDIPEKIDDTGMRVFVNHKIKNNLGGVPIIGGIVGMDTSAFKPTVYDIKSKSLNFVTRGWEANEEPVWDQAVESGINIVTTDKVYDAEFAKLARGNYFSYPTYTFKYDTGQEVDIGSAASGDFGFVVEIHEDPDGKNLWHSVGAVSPTKRTIGWAKAVKHDTGQQPNIAITPDGVCVEVHKSQNNNGLWWNIGVIDPISVSFGSAKMFAEGSHPAIALFGNAGFITFAKDDKIMYFRVKVSPDGKSLQFAADQAEVLGVAGQAPDCVMHSATKGRCVYESRSGNELYTAVLSFEGEDKITITDSEKYGKGSKPSITVFTDFQGVQRYVEAHEVSGGKLHAIYGTKVDGGRLSDGESYQFDTGVDPSLSVTPDGILIHAHKSQNKDDLYASAYDTKNACELPQCTTLAPKFFKENDEYLNSNDCTGKPSNVPPGKGPGVGQGMNMDNNGVGTGNPSTSGPPTTDEMSVASHSLPSFIAFAISILSFFY